MDAPMICRVHVRPGQLRSSKSVIAGFTFEWKAMAVVFHVVLSRFLVPERSVASIATPVSHCIHVLTDGMPVHKLTITRFAFMHRCDSAGVAVVDPRRWWDNIGELFELDVGELFE